MLPRWLRYSLVFAAVAFVSAAVDLYIISLTPFVVGAMAVWLVKKLEGNRCE